MKSFLMLGAAVAVVAAMASNGKLPGNLANATASSDEAYLLRFAGLNAVCTIRRASSLSAADTRLVIGEGCSEAIGDAAVWRDNADGSVSFVSVNGRTILEFAQADGAAYETFRAGAPLASLVATD